MRETKKPVSQTCSRGEAAAESMAAAKSILPPCGSQGLSGNQASQTQVLSTDSLLEGDLMFILGGLGEERTVPVGASFPDRGIRNDQHDAVAAQLMIPIGKIHPLPPPAAGGAPQPAATSSSAAGAAPKPAAAASHAERDISPPASDPPQPAEEPSDTEQPTPPDWPGSESEQDLPERACLGVNSALCL